MRKKKTFRYVAPSVDSLQRRIKEGSSGRTGFVSSQVTEYRMVEGGNSIRILPPTWESESHHYGLDIWVHFQVGPTHSHVLCIDRMQRFDYCDEAIRGQICPVCQEIETARESGDQEYLKQLYPSSRVFYWIIDRNNEGKGPQLLAVSKAVDDQLSFACIDRQANEVIPIADPYEGYDIFISRTGTGLMTRYSGATIARRPSPLSRDQATQDGWLGYIEENPLTSVLIYHDQDKVAELFQGHAAPAARAPEPEQRSLDLPQRDDAPFDPDQDIEDEAAPEEPEEQLSWESIQALGLDELDAVCVDHDLNVQTQSFDENSLADYRAQVAAALGVEKPKAKAAGGNASDRQAERQKRLKALRESRAR